MIFSIFFRKIFFSSCYLSFRVLLISQSFLSYLPPCSPSPSLNVSEVLRAQNCLLRFFPDVPHHNACCSMTRTFQKLFPYLYSDGDNVYLCAQSCPTFCDPMDCSHTRLLCPWNFPDKNTGVGCHFLFQWIFPTQGSNLHLFISCIGRQILYHTLGSSGIII